MRPGDIVARGEQRGGKREGEKRRRVDRDGAEREKTNKEGGKQLRQKSLEAVPRKAVTMLWKKKKKKKVALCRVP